MMKGDAKKGVERETTWTITVTSSPDSIMNSD